MPTDHGSNAATRSSRLTPCKVKAVDTTGAGDLYAAGFLYGFSHGFSLDKCGLFGSVLAGKVIEVIGARMPDNKWEEAKRMINIIAED
ncbi:MAG: PfkB family carbohydrate kinase [Marinilabiliales bacterium]|nr:PfkB family carbohydrate kinase [Marinilabiliales bacterium]